MRHPRTAAVGVALGATLLGLTTAPAASAAQGTFSYDQQVITNPVDGTCYRLFGSSSSWHTVANRTDTTAYVSTGSSCGGPQVVQLAPGMSGVNSTAYGSVMFR
ncbi:hypothetical protein Kfla_3747 [Kribbella flavida DSM 17836]|uniref:Uncharacterized protein n=1 Tax=Kribbella flavida (strain DSM 17836 / JCM 10339 / NBRC 14399) TaxID=479435 RepID=D2PNY4_KRIFD|nr:hypothetical protein [Kribbella flavida]ADB32802.1 hypothetical protein Kfla_3747 [Kribbella flavida DSM 17836]